MWSHRLPGTKSVSPMSPVHTILNLCATLEAGYTQKVAPGTTKWLTRKQKTKVQNEILV